jgi:hypothetical protein
LHEIAFKCAVFRSFSDHFRTVFAHTTARLYLAAAARDAFRLSRGPKAAARKSFYFKE